MKPIKFSLHFYHHFIFSSELNALQGCIFTKLISERKGSAKPSACQVCYSTRHSEFTASYRVQIFILDFLELNLEGHGCLERIRRLYAESVDIGSGTYAIRKIFEQGFT